MARQIRIQYPGAHYHVIARGERKDAIFYDIFDYKKFLVKLNETLVKFNIRCVSYVLMPNHYHLYLITNEPNLVKAMHYLNSSYTNWFKKKHQITGHVFQGRYKAILIDHDNYSLNVIDYIHMNPVKAYDIPAWDYEWSSCRVYCSEELNDDLVDTDFYFKHYSDISEAKEKYRIHLINLKNYELPHRDLYKGIALGKKEFKKKIDFYIKKSKKDYYVPTTRMEKTRNYIEYLDILCRVFDINKDEIFSSSYKNNYRKAFIFILRKYTRMKNKDISQLFDLKAGSISDILRRVNQGLNDKNSEIFSYIKKIECELRRPDPI